ncbi:MAG: hypothetical protein Kow0076_0400 [Francisella sp.]
MLLKQKFLLIIAIVIGFLGNCYCYETIEHFKYNKNILLTGVVTEIPVRKDNQYEFVFHSYKYGDILLKSDISYYHYLIPANKLEIEAKIYKPHEYDNLVSFNYAKYLEHKNIVAVGKVIKNSDISYKGLSILYLPERFRYYLYDYLQSKLKDYKQKDFAIALLIGYKNFSKFQQSILINTGTSHLMVISGLHVGLLSLIAFILFRGIWSFFPSLCRYLPAQYIGVISSVIVAFIYSLLAGFSLPTQRALIMLLVVAILWLFGKRISIIKSLLFAFVIILLLDFKSVYNIGFWLSFSAVALLVVISIILQLYKSKLGKTVLSQIYLAIFLMPISVYFFDGFSASSILANIIAIPLVSLLIVPLLLLSLFLSFLGINLWFLPMLLLHLLINYLNFLTYYVSFINYWSYFSFFSLAIVIGGVFLVIFPFSKSFRILGLVMCLIFFQHSQDSSKKYKFFQISIFDTKNQMVLIQDEGKNLLYTSAINLDNQYVIDNILSHYLKLHNIGLIDYLIIVDDNHKKINLNFIRSVAKVRTIITNLHTSENVKKCNYDNNFKLNNASIKLLSNDNSCFVSLNYRGKEFLLTDNSSNKYQRNIYALYNRVINPYIIITPTIINSKFINKKVSYIVYVSDKPFDEEYLQKHKIKIIDTYANGLININIDRKGALIIRSQLKFY